MGQIGPCAFNDVDARGTDRSSSNPIKERISPGEQLALQPPAPARLEITHPVTGQIGPGPTGACPSSSVLQKGKHGLSYCTDQSISIWLPPPPWTDPAS